MTGSFSPTSASSGEINTGELPLKWRTMPHGISVGRYIDSAFQRLEYERLWRRVWQVAARVDEIPETNDYTTYEIGDQSVFVVRRDRDTIKVYHNFCPHRGTALTQGVGNFDRGRIICPFHGWRWDTAGNNHYVLESQEFRGGQLKSCDVHLKEVSSVVFAGFVFINLDPNSEPFDNFISPIRQLLEDLAIGEMHHYWWKCIHVPANWKVAQEAFFETYHVPATHPQLEKISAEVIYGDRSESDTQFMHRNVEYETYSHGHGRFYGGDKTPMAGNVKSLDANDPVDIMAARLQLLVDGMDAQVLQDNVDLLYTLRGKAIPEGSSLGHEYIKALYCQAEEQQRPMPKACPEIIGMWGGEIFLFPNIMILPNAGNAMMYRVRPAGEDPNFCLFEIYSTRTLPAATKPSRSIVEQITDFDDPKQVRLIPQQDLGNIPRMQKGMHSCAMRQTWLASHQEKIILNMHRELDRYLLE